MYSNRFSRCFTMNTTIFKSRIHPINVSFNLWPIRLFLSSFTVHIYKLGYVNYFWNAKRILTDRNFYWLIILSWYQFHVVYIELVTSLQRKWNFGTNLRIALLCNNSSTSLYTTFWRSRNWKKSIIYGLGSRDCNKDYWMYTIECVTSYYISIRSISNTRNCGRDNTQVVFEFISDISKS